MNLILEKLKQKISKITDTATERSYYPSLCSFFEEYAKSDAIKLKEPSATPEETSKQYESKIGFPDITIRNRGLLIGWVEVKAPKENLNADKYFDQFSKYRDSLENIIFTNLREWQLWQWVDGEPKKTSEALLDLTDISSASNEGFDQLMQKFFEGRAYQARTPKQLALALAKKTRLLSKQVEEALEKSSEDSDLCKLKNTFEKTLIQNISEHQFANMVAETMAYSLFLAALEHSCHGKDEELTLTNAIDYLPTNVPILADLYSLIKKVSGTIPSIYEATRLIVDQLNASEISRIHQKLVEHKPGEDPVIQFYEPFLKEYDPHERESRGVYYTPKPVVDYIVKSVDWILRNKFNKPRGLADESVHVLDPATGTGTFLMSAIQEIHSNIQKENAALGDEMVRREFRKIVENHILKHFYGFELLIAPYAIAHLKLALEVERLGFDFSMTKDDDDPDNDRFKVYLANTLDNPEKPPLSLFGFDSIPKESDCARQIKKNAPILAIIGNPPYSKITTNLSSYMKSLVEPYKYIDGKRIKERGALQLEINLNDDYVKFIAFSQKQILKHPEGGVVALITNHNYLDNPTLYGMRYNLGHSFSEIFIFDLKGNLQKARGTKKVNDENVFDIQQGVSIAFFIKLPKSNASYSDVYYASIEGTRESKYEYLIDNTISSTKFDKLSPVKPHYFYVKRDDTNDEEYAQYEKITDMFPCNSAGIITARDNLALDDTEDGLLKKISIYRTSREADHDLAQQLGISVKKGWDMGKSRANVRKIKDLRDYIHDILYRPFLKKKIFYDPNIVWSMSYPVTRNFFSDNIGLVFTRQITSLNWAHVQITKCTVEIKSNSHDRSSQFAPLYLYQKKHDELPLESDPFVVNLAVKVIKRFSEKTGLSYIQSGLGNLNDTFGPEAILYYVYAILHSPNYRSRYAEQLKIDFPRIPITSDSSLFKLLVKHGNQLANLHLIDGNPFCNKKTVLSNRANWHVKIGGAVQNKSDDWKISNICYDERKQRVYVNNGQYFEGVEKNIWEFVIGGYQVCEKWLKEHKKQDFPLSTDNLKEFMKIIAAIRETIRIMKEIDEAIQSWPIQ